MSGHRSKRSPASASRSMLGELRSEVFPAQASACINREEERASERASERDRERQREGEIGSKICRRWYGRRHHCTQGRRSSRTRCALGVSVQQHMYRARTGSQLACPLPARSGAAAAPTYCCRPSHRRTELAPKISRSNRSPPCLRIRSRWPALVLRPAALRTGARLLYLASALLPILYTSVHGTRVSPRRRSARAYACIHCIVQAAQSERRPARRARAKITLLCVPHNLRLAPCNFCLQNSQRTLMKS